ncbi:MAG: hypothetical protein R3194_11935, partial [Limnobacter sp.]|nr:hypothetical protein [Limnobacter sp.]
MNPPAVVSLLLFLLLFTLIQLLYTSVITPSAEMAIAQQGSAAATNPWVILKDLEQQICITLGLYCAFLIGYKWFVIKQNEVLSTKNFLENKRENRLFEID